MGTDAVRRGAIGVLVVGLALVGCAAAAPVTTVPAAEGDSPEPSATTTHSPITTQAVVDTGSAPPTPSTTCANGEGFDISLPSYQPRPEPYGAATPGDAARSTQWGRPAQYGSLDTVWTTVTSSPSSVELSSGEGATLVVVQLTDRSWFVLSGERCR